jgi:glycosyltransferase involved in cell wall biosynthesis
MSRAVLLLDARWLKSGIGRYTLGLLRHLRNSLAEADLWCITNSAHAAIVGQFCDRIIPCDTGIYSFKEQLALPQFAREACLYHAPHYNLPLLRRGRTAVTIHDLNHLLDPQYRNSWKSWLYARPMLFAAAHRADHIFTVSQYSKATIVEHLRIRPEKITVTGCSVAPIFRPHTAEEIHSRLRGYLEDVSSYLLFVGDFRPNKNLPTLLRAFSLLQRRATECPLLVLAGGDEAGWKSLRPLIEKLGLHQHVRWLPSTPDDVLAALYAGARMTILPSLQEGFGLPVIESMSCGTPVICANAASLPEVAGGAALLFDPYSAEDLLEKICQLMGSCELWTELSLAGCQRAAVFTGERQAQRHAEVYRTLLG